MGEDMALKRPGVMGGIGEGIGDVTRASMFIVGPLLGDSSRSRREDSLFTGFE